MVCFLLGLAVSRSAWTVGVSPFPFGVLTRHEFNLSLSVVGWEVVPTS